MAIRDITDRFKFFLPIDRIEKSGADEPRRYIQGIASTDDVDLQGETILQSGIDFSYFLSHGYINDDHGPVKVGEPTEARITRAGFWIRAFLYKGMARSDYWWEFMQSLERSGATRKVGFSIEGKVDRRSGKSILSCWLRNVAITDSPINTKTWAEISKSLLQERWCKHPWKSDAQACNGCPGTCSKEKGLAAAGIGRPLIPQSLEGDAKLRGVAKGLSGNVTHQDTVRYLEMEKGYSHVAAIAVADAIFLRETI